MPLCLPPVTMLDRDNKGCANIMRRKFCRGAYLPTHASIFWLEVTAGVVACRRLPVLCSRLNLFVRQGVLYARRSQNWGSEYLYHFGNSEEGLQ